MKESEFIKIQHWNDNSLVKLERRTSSVLIILGVLAVIIERTEFFRISNPSFFYRIIFLAFAILGAIHLIYDFRLKNLVIQVNEFKNKLESKQDFYLIFNEIFSPTETWNFEKQKAEKQEFIGKVFPLREFEFYIEKWKKVNSVFNSKDTPTRQELDIGLLLLPYKTLKSLARLLGTKVFCKLILDQAILHNFVTIDREEIQEERLVIYYKINNLYIQKVS